MYTDEETQVGFGHRFGGALDRIEATYLKVLRAIILLIATAFLVYVGWLAISGLYKVTRSPDSVVEQAAVVEAPEIIDAQASEAPSQNARSTGENPEQRAFYQSFAKRYFALFRGKFEPFRQTEDKKLTADEFDDAHLNTTSRLEAVKAGEIDFVSDKNDLERLLVVMTQASELPQTRERLQKYKNAEKVAVKKTQQRMRTSYRSGWDSNSSNCEGWFYSPVGCAVQRQVQTPYNVVVTEMQFPAGTQSHSAVFGAIQDRYFSLLEERRIANASKAASERSDIELGIQEGYGSFATAMYVVGGFLILMFFFLLIAIERHQRKISADLKPQPDFA